MHTPLRVLIGSPAAGMLSTLAADPPDGTLLLHLGVEHPSSAGLLELRLWVEADLITSAEVVVGAMHRGVEKLFEVRDYRQILMLADRHDWQAPFNGELTVALACERLLGLEVPVRATWLRTLLAEHTRVLSHLGTCAYLSSALGSPSLVHPVRERLREQTQALTGNRIHPMACRIGGLGVDADHSWLEAEMDVVVIVRKVAQQLNQQLSTPKFQELSSGVMPMDHAMVLGYGVSGPPARALGVVADLRVTRPYLAYAELDDLITAPAQPPRSTAADQGDALSRFAVMIGELSQSANLIEAAADRLFGLPGPVSTRLSKVVRLPEGESYCATESATGIAGVFVVSRGEKTPWRLKLRTASFNNMAALEAALPGQRVSQLETALASIGYVVGDIDK